MPQLTIDNTTVTVPEGATVLDAARAAGIDIPTLCHLQGVRPLTSCLVCLVRDRSTGRVVPSCGTPAVEGARYESETAEVHAMRRSALELLLSEHVGDCLAPCFFACPARMDIPLMLRQIAAGQLRAAIATIKRDIALPAVLGRICPAPCERACRRGNVDAAVAICRLKRFAADADLDSGDPYLPPRAAPSGKRVAVVGGGPSGLAAAYYLAAKGHVATIYEREDRLGGRLWRETTPHELPRDVLEREIASLLAAGIEAVCRRAIDPAGGCDRLLADHDAVLLCCGAVSADEAARWGIAHSGRGLEVAAKGFQTARPAVFAAGCAVRGRAMVVRSTADGKEAAESIDQFLRGETPAGPGEPFNCRIGKMAADELTQLAAGSARLPRAEPDDPTIGYAASEAAAQAARCLHCDCRKQDDCRLRKYAAQYGASLRRFAAERKPFAQDLRHAEVVYEPGKCIQCGLCIEIARAAGEPLGLTFVGRGFDVRVSAPLGREINDALQRAAAACVAACPTAALAWKHDGGPSRRGAQ